MRRQCLLVLFLSTISATAFAVQTCSDAILSTTPDLRFTTSGDEVTDAATGLIWQLCTPGQTGTNCSGTPFGHSWQSALLYAESQRTDTGKAWRVPNKKELESILEEKCLLPSINLNVFPGTLTFNNPPTFLYWTATTTAGQSNAAWYVSFRDGAIANGSKGDIIYIRLVRDPQ